MFTKRCAGAGPTAVAGSTCDVVDTLECYTNHNRDPGLVAAKADEPVRRLVLLTPERGTSELRRASERWQVRYCEFE